jgi:HAD superfamily hydrolase (TIGR01509 family)
VSDSIQAFLVDLDGTLADTASANFAAYAEALREHGVKISRAVFDKVASGRNWRQFLPELLGERADAAEEVAARKAVLYPEMLGSIEINHGLVALLETFTTLGKPAALVTTASRSAVDAILERHDLARLFEATITGDDVTAHKPDKEPYLKGAAAVRSVPSRCLALEDTLVGAQSAVAAGCKVLMVSMHSNHSAWKIQR